MPILRAADCNDSRDSRARAEEVKEASTFWPGHTGTPNEWIDCEFNNAVGMAAGQEMYAPILNPLADPTAAVAYPQLPGRELAVHLLATGHVDFDELGRALDCDPVQWLSSNKKHKSFDMPCPDYSCDVWVYSAGFRAKREITATVTENTSRPNDTPREPYREQYTGARTVKCYEWGGNCAMVIQSSCAYMILAQGPISGQLHVWSPSLCCNDWEWSPASEVVTHIGLVPQVCAVR